MAFGEDTVAAFVGDPVVYALAQAYFRQGRVRLLASSPTQIEGEVAGSEDSRYRAVFTLLHGGL